METDKKYTEPMSKKLIKALEKEGFFVVKCEPFFYTVSRIRIAEVDVKYFFPHRFKRNTV